MKKLIGISLLALMLAGCKSDDETVQQTQPTPAWRVLYSRTMPNGNGAAFTFPTDHDGVHYVCNSRGAQAGQIIKMVFRLDGTGSLHANEGTTPARIRLYMQRSGDGMSANEPYKRWWSKAYIELNSPGQFTLQCMIIPSEWTSVFGECGTDSAAASEGFIDCVANLENLGYTFGGTFAGHGVYAVGDVRFTLLSYDVV